MRYIVLALLFAVVTIAAGILALSQKRQPQESATLTPPPSLSQTKTPTDTTTQMIVDDSAMISYEIPSNWKVIKEGRQGVQVSSLQAESPDFLMKTDEQTDGPFTSIYYETGSQLQVSVQNNTRPSSDRPTGEMIEEKKVKVDGVDADYFRYKEASTREGEILDVRFSENNISYFFRFAYNPDTLSQGENIFFTIIDSVVLNKGV